LMREVFLSSRIILLEEGSLRYRPVHLQVQPYRDSRSIIIGDSGGYNLWEKSELQMGLR